MAKAVAVVLAGGSGSRLGADRNKVYVLAGGRPLLSYALGAFNRATSIDAMVVVVREGEHDRAREAVHLAVADKTVAIVTGGPNRQDSEAAGLDAIRSQIVRAEIDVVAMHDGARPFVSVALIDAVVERAAAVGGAVPGLLVEEPLFRRTPEGPLRVPDRIVRVQTPQAFRAPELLQAHDRAQRAGDASAADTAEVVARFGSLEVQLVAGDPDNLKVTFARDLERAHELARNQSWRQL